MATSLVAVVVLCLAWLAGRWWRGGDEAHTLDEIGASGWYARWLGDLDGDRVSDFALLTAFERARSGPEEWGVIRVLSGATGKVLRTFPGVGAFVDLAELVGPAGDVDGEGRPELWWKEGGHELLLGKAGESRSALRLEVGYRARAVPLGDVDGDRCTDLLVGRYPSQLPGRYAASAISGRTGATLWTLTFPYTEAPASAVGPRNQVERVGDCDGDGIEDAGLVDEQERLVLVGGASGTILRTLPLRVTSRGRFESLGDLDGDGRPELLHYEGHLPRIDADRFGPPAQVVSSLDGKVLASYPTGELVVYSVFSPGDVDGDGHLDVAWQEGLTLEVVSALDGRPLRHLEDVSAAPGRGDWNGDGCADLLVTRNVYLGEGAKAPADLWRKGRVEVISGKDGSVLHTFDEGVLP